MALKTDRMRKSASKLRKLLKRVPKQPSPKQVHDLRTCTRRLEAGLDALGIDFRHNEHRLLRTLSRLRKSAGKVRDMDVLTGYASTIHLKREQDCLVQLLEHLGAERYRYARKMWEVKQKQGPELRQRLARTAKRLKKLSRRAHARRRAREDVMATSFQLSSELNTPARLSKRTLHAFRLKVKELRYVLQLADGAHQQPFADSLGEVKDAIGRWHDWEALTGVATKLLNHGGNCELLVEVKRRSNAEYSHSLSLANEMRKIYLRPHLRNPRPASKTKRTAETAPAIPIDTSSTAQ
jgi:CHAD domain-containing protein